MSGMNRKEVEELAERIDAHLKRFEHDPEINKASSGRMMNITPYFHAHASRAYGPTVSITYISFQGTSKLKPEEAQAYLKWLDDGNIGTHYRIN